MHHRFLGKDNSLFGTICVHIDMAPQQWRIANCAARYEGNWDNDLKHGDGKFFYLDKGQQYEGTWVDGTAKCGIFIDLQRQNAEDPTQYPLPELGLFDPRAVLAESRREHFESLYEEAL